MATYKITFKPGTKGGNPRAARESETVEAGTFEEDGTFVVFWTVSVPSGRRHEKVHAVPSKDVESITQIKQ